MTIYSVHSKELEPRESLAALDSVKFVKEGFCWPGFALPLIWLLYHRMWIVLIIVSCWFIGLGILEQAVRLPEHVTPLASIATCLFMGFEGRRLQRWSLKRRGYRYLGLSAGENRTEAELRFFLNRPFEAEAV